LRSRLAASDVRVEFEHTVWLLEPGFGVETVGPNGRAAFRADALIVASGTSELVVPTPGWTLPGVIGLGAATVLVKAQGILPGARTVVAGCGPLVLAAAGSIMKAGGQVAAVVDLNGITDVLRLLPRMAGRPDLFARGGRWIQQAYSSGATILSRHAVVAVEGDREVSAVIVAPVDRLWKPIASAPSLRIVADTLAIGHGLVPATEATRLLGARHVFVPASGGWIPEHDDLGRTSVPHLYVAGDVAGIAGAAAALLRGRRAGLTAARDLGKLTETGHRTAVDRLRAKLRRAESFGAAAAALMHVRPGLFDTVTPDTVVCRCEDITRLQIEEAVARGARTLNEVKAATRCGMGPCQGRMCGETAATLVGAQICSREAAGAWTARPPLRPVLLDPLTGDFDYEAIVMQSPAPA
jgi:thioredoxin reductase/bacterioferritin-associated ferredoxin